MIAIQITVELFCELFFVMTVISAEGLSSVCAILSLRHGYLLRSFHSNLWIDQCLLDDMITITTKKASEATIGVYMCVDMFLGANNSISYVQE
jgi:hypothetical protein